MIRFIPYRIIAAAVVLIAALTGLMLREEQLRQSGREVRLAIAAVDPRDLLTGHYVAMTMQQTLPGNVNCPPGAANPPAIPSVLPHTRFYRPQWVALRREGDHFVPSGAAPARADAQRLGAITVRGLLGCEGVPAVETLDIGVSRFHADQQDAERIAAALQTWNNPPPAYAIVSIGADGRARLKGVEIAGKRSMLSWF